MEDLVKSVAYKLGFGPNDLRAEMNMLLYMEAGSRVDWCVDDEDSDKCVGVLYIQLPSAFTGGEVSIFSGQSDDEEATETFDLGAGGEAQFACYYLAHFADCQYCFEPVMSGSRILLRYTLMYQGRGPTPSARLLQESISPLRWAFDNLKPMDRMVLHPLCRKYSSSQLIMKGLSALSSDHRSKAEAIISGAPGWTVLIVNCKLVHKRETGYYGDVIKSSKASSVLGVYDVEGRDVTAAEKPFLKGALDFTSAARNHSGVDPGMVLTSNEGVALGDSWGSGSLTSSDERYYGGHNKTYTYNATFVLAYDR